MIVMNLNLHTYILRSLDGKFFGFHSLIAFLKVIALVLTLILSTLKVQYPRF